MPDSSGAVAASSQSSSEARLQRVLKFVVVALGVLLLAGLLAAIGRVIYLASGPATQPAVPSPAIRPGQYLELPPGAQVRSISLSGDRLAVHYMLDGATGIAVLDLKTGKKITNVSVMPVPPSE